MKLEEIVKSLLAGRIIDLSKKVVPGKAAGPLDTGSRRYEIKQFTYPPGELMHYIDMESHISTHIEAPSHFVPVRHPGRTGNDISELALTKFIGMAVLIDCKKLPPRTPIGKGVLEKFDIKEDDIVLFGRCPHPGQDRCYITKDGVEYLVKKKVKMVGVDDTVFPEDMVINRERKLETYFTHDFLLSNDIPLIKVWPTWRR